MWTLWSLTVFFRGSAAGLQVFTCTGKGAEGSSKPLQNSLEASRAGGSPKICRTTRPATFDLPPDLQQTTAEWYKIQLGGFRSNDILKLVGPATTIWQKQNWQNVTAKNKQTWIDIEDMFYHVAPSYGDTWYIIWLLNGEKWIFRINALAKTCCSLLAQSLSPQLALVEHMRSCSSVNRTFSPVKPQSQTHVEP